MAFWGKARRASGPPASPEVGFGASAYARLAERIERATELADARGVPVIASVTVPLSPAVEPITCVEVAARSGGHWSVFAQPARDDFSLATIDVAHQIDTSSSSRFETIARAAGQALDGVLADDLFDDPTAPPGAGVVWTGGFAFLAAESYADTWRDFGAAQFVLPRASIVRRGGDQPQARLTLNVAARPGAILADELAQIEQVVDQLELDEPAATRAFVPRTGEAAITSVAAPEHFERAVEQAAEEIRAGAYEKVVLAREIVLRRERSIDPFNAVRGLTARFPECTTFAVSEGSTTFLGASPELLVRREGRRASTMALAGSMRRGADPETDAHLSSQLMTSGKNRSEHDIVVKRIEKVLGRFSAWVAAPESPEVVKMKNIQHLATPIRAQLTEPRPVIELAGALHPTPAVGGEPWDATRDRIRALEGFDRGWYTGAVGWMDLFEDGEFHVALRSALIDGPQARLFAGCGIVGDSDPAAELAETETKLQALLPVLEVS